MSALPLGQIPKEKLEQHRTGILCEEPHEKLNGSAVTVLRMAKNEIRLVIRSSRKSGSSGEIVGTGSRLLRTVWIKRSHPDHWGYRFCKRTWPFMSQSPIQQYDWRSEGQTLTRHARNKPLQFAMHDARKQRTEIR